MLVRMYAYREFNRAAPIDRPTQVAVQKWQTGGCSASEEGVKGNFSLKTLQPGSTHHAAKPDAKPNEAESASQSSNDKVGKKDYSKLAHRAALIATEALKAAETDDRANSGGVSNAPIVGQAGKSLAHPQITSQDQRRQGGHPRLEKIVTIASSILKAYVATSSSSPHAQINEAVKKPVPSPSNSLAGSQPEKDNSDAESDAEVGELLDGLIPSASSKLPSGIPEQTWTSPGVRPSESLSLPNSLGTPHSPATVITLTAAPQAATMSKSAAKPSLTHTPQAFAWPTQAEIDAKKSESTASGKVASSGERRRVGEERMSKEAGLSVRDRSRGMLSSGEVDQSHVASTTANSRHSRSVITGTDGPTMRDELILNGHDSPPDRRRISFDPLVGPWPIAPSNELGHHNTMSPRFAEVAADRDRPKERGVDVGDESSSQVLAQIGSIAVAMDDCLQVTRQAVDAYNGTNDTLNELGTWLHRQLPLIQRGSDLFEHAQMADVEGLATALEAVRSTLSRSGEPALDQLHERSAILDSAFLKMSAGAVMGYMDHHAWHLTSGMQSTLVTCRRLLESSPVTAVSATVLQIIPKLRNQLHLTTPERLAHPEADAAHRDSHELLDIVSSSLSS